jgi:hypothetical protein
MRRIARSPGTLPGSSGVVPASMRSYSTVARCVLSSCEKRFASWLETGWVACRSVSCKTRFPTLPLRAARLYLAIPSCQTQRTEASATPPFRATTIAVTKIGRLVTCGNKHSGGVSTHAPRCLGGSHRVPSLPHSNRNAVQARDTAVDPRCLEKNSHSVIYLTRP